MHATRLGIASWRVALAIGCIVFAALAVRGGPETLGLAAFGLSLAILLVWSGVRAPNAACEEDSLEAGADGITFGAKRFPISQLRRARVVPMDGWIFLDIRRGQLRPPLRFRMTSADDAGLIVEQLRLDSRRVRDSFRLTLRVLHTHAFHFGLNLVTNFAFAFGGWAGGGLVCSAYALAALASAANRVDVGPDGVCVRRFFRTMHLPLSSIRQATVAEERRGGVLVRVAHDGGWPLELWMSEWDAGAFRTRIAEITRERDAVPNANAEHLLAGRKAAELRTLGDRPETFRQTGIDRETLLRIVETPSTPAPIRARAAVVLSASDDEARARLRAVAEHSTIPPLRVVLERVDADDGALDEALQDLDRASA
ncbi:MAG: hypothetical protein HYV09_25025 [Deltaproteobacteria bacterium]|nr:hypothetical protein [Deltaproteobacteria bacterium]